MNNFNTRRKILKSLSALPLFIAFYGVYSLLNKTDRKIDGEPFKVLAMLKYKKDYNTYLVDVESWINHTELETMLRKQMKDGDLLSFETKDIGKYFEVQMVFKNVNSYVKCDYEYDSITNKALRSQLGYAVERKFSFES